MNTESVSELSRLLRECIRRIENATDDGPDDAQRSLRRVLALLWHACEELTLISEHELVDSP